MNVRNNKMNVPFKQPINNVQFRKLEGIYISASEKNITKCTHTVYNVTCLMKRKQLVAKSFTSLIYTNFNGRICVELVKLLKLKSCCGMSLLSKFALFII